MNSIPVTPYAQRLSLQAHDMCSAMGFGEFLGIHKQNYKWSLSFCRAYAIPVQTSISIPLRSGLDARFYASLCFWRSIKRGCWGCMGAYITVCSPITHLNIPLPTLIHSRYSIIEIVFSIQITGVISQTFYFKFVRFYEIWFSLKHFQLLEETVAFHMKRRHASPMATASLQLFNHLLLMPKFFDLWIQSDVLHPGFVSYFLKII